MSLGISQLFFNYLLLNKPLYKRIHVVQKHKMCFTSPLAISTFQRARTSLLVSARDHSYCQVLLEKFLLHRVDLA